MFTEAGVFKVLVREAFWATPPDWRKEAGPDDFDVVLDLVRVDEPNEFDYWRGEISNQYCKIRGKTHLTQREVTEENLLGVGCETLANITDLVDQEITITIKASKGDKTHEDGTPYMNVYLGGWAPVKITGAEAKRRLQAMCGSAKPAAEKPAATARRPARAAAPVASTSTPFDDDDDNIPF